MRKIGLSIAIVLITSILLGSVTASGQVLTANNDWSRLNSVNAGTRLEIKLMSGKTIGGKFNSVSDSLLSVTDKGKSMEVKREDVQAVYQVTKKSATKGALIGLGAGAGVGLGVGLAGRDNNDFNKIENAATAGLTVLGAGAGALVGYLVGRSGRKKELLYAK
jgi:hypothetical protein